MSVRLARVPTAEAAAASVVAAGEEAAASAVAADREDIESPGRHISAQKMTKPKSRALLCDKISRGVAPFFQKGEAA